MTSDPSDHGIDFDYRGDVTRAVESALARARSGDVQEVAYFAACRAIRDYDAADLSPLASLDDYRADYDASIWNAVNAAVLDAGYDPDELDLDDDVDQAHANADAAVMVAIDGGGREDYAAAQAFTSAADYRPPKGESTARIVPIAACPGSRHRRTSGARPAHRRGSRRTATRAGPSDDPDGEPEPPGRSRRHLDLAALPTGGPSSRGGGS